MKTYDSERRELFNKLNDDLAKIDARWVEKNFDGGSYIGGQDSAEDAERHEVISEYNNNLRILKEKYGRAK